MKINRAYLEVQTLPITDSKCTYRSHQFFFSMYFINVITLHATSRIVVCIINFLHHARKYVKKSFVEIALVHRTKAKTI